MLRGWIELILPQPYTTGMYHLQDPTSRIAAALVSPYYDIKFSQTHMQKNFNSANFNAYFNYCAASSEQSLHSFFKARLNLTLTWDEDKVSTKHSATTALMTRNQIQVSVGNCCISTATGSSSVCCYSRWYQLKFYQSSLTLKPHGAALSPALRVKRCWFDDNWSRKVTQAWKETRGCRGCVTISTFLTDKGDWLDSRIMKWT